jgi:hypothetical protein
MYFNTNDSQIINGDNQTVIGANQNRNDDIHNNNYESGFGKDELLEYNNVDVENADDDGRDDEEDYKKDDNKDDDNDENEKVDKESNKDDKDADKDEDDDEDEFNDIMYNIDHSGPPPRPTIN